MIYSRLFVLLDTPLSFSSSAFSAVSPFLHFSPYSAYSTLWVSFRTVVPNLGKAPGRIYFVVLIDIVLSFIDSLEISSIFLSFVVLFLRYSLVSLLASFNFLFFQFLLFQFLLFQFFLSIFFSSTFFFQFARSFTSHFLSPELYRRSFLLAVFFR